MRVLARAEMKSSDKSYASAWWALAIVLIVSCLYESRFLHFGVNRIDESWQLYAAMRLHAGGVLYDDIFWVFPPGHAWSAWLAWWWDPPGIVPARWIYAGFNVALAGVIYVLARRLMSQPFALLAGLLVALAAPRGHTYQAIFGYRYLVIPMLALLAFDQRLRGRDARWMVVSGALTGLALVFRLTPAFSVSCGIAVALVATHRDFRKWLPEGLRFAAGLLLVMAPVLAWFATSVGLPRLWQEVVLHPLAMLQPLPLPEINFPDLSNRRRIAAWFVAVQFRAIWIFYAAYAVALAGAWLRTRQRKESFQQALLLSIVVFGAVFFVRSTGRSDELHLDSVIPLVCLLVAHFIGVAFEWSWPRAWDGGRRLVGTSVLIAGILASWVYLLSTDIVVFRGPSDRLPLESTHQHLLVGPAHKAIDIDRTIDLLKQVTKPEDVILNLGPTPLFHALSGRIGPGYFDVIMPGTFLNDAQERWFVAHLRANPPAAVIWPTRTFDEMEERSVNQIAPRTSAWVQENYRPLPGQLGSGPRRVPRGTTHRGDPWNWIVMVPEESGG